MFEESPYRSSALVAIDSRLDSRTVLGVSETLVEDREIIPLMAAAT
jgi:hypothetical protein